MAQPDPAFEALLEHLREMRGFDFTGYKRSSLTRRVDRRMAQVGVSGYGEYLEHLEVHPDEFTALFNTILINVTGFFRDPETWEYLRTAILPDLLAAKGDDEPVRVWSAGCASGEEAYTIAIVLAELMGADEFRRRVKIYATDVDEEGLAQARQATYSARKVGGVDPELLERYFERSGARYVFRPDLRRSVIFGRNDLVQDAPISRIDLLVCRNTLMYFNAETQARILARFHFALADGRVLFLGKAEMLLSHTALFAPVDLKLRVFRKVPRQAPVGALLVDPPDPPPRPAPTRPDMLRDEALLAGPLAQVVVTADGFVALVSREAERLLALSADTAGRRFRDLDLSYRPIELRQHVERAQIDRRPVRIPEVAVGRGDERTYLEIRITPLLGTDSTPLGVSIAFSDVTAARRQQDRLEEADRRLQSAHEELQSTNEELETTNEELQSTVEELETMNEELQSTNDELQLINHELQHRTSELDAANSFLETILTGLRAGVVVLGRELQVQVWNAHAEELWGLRRDEAVGEHFLNLDIGLPVDRLRPMIRRILGMESGPAELTVGAVNRRGRPISVRVLGSPLHGPSRSPVGVILMMEQENVAVPVDGPRTGTPTGPGQGTRS
ncbi:MAG TPA: CheR family methyltransferase [Pseudonocardia sp.]|nr:CheR family methyltransferase [Pseudonocardia sp.]